METIVLSWRGAAIEKKELPAGTRKLAEYLERAGSRKQTGRRRLENQMTGGSGIACNFPSVKAQSVKLHAMLYVRQSVLERCDCWLSIPGRLQRATLHAMRMAVMLPASVVGFTNTDSSLLYFKKGFAP